MKVWKVDTLKVFNEKNLEARLNELQKQNKQIKEIIFNSVWNEYQIIYTIEDEDGE